MKKLVCESLEELRENYYDEPEEKIPAEVQDTMYQAGKKEFDQISAQEFDDYLEEVLNSGKHPAEVIEEVKKFIDDHPYMHHEFGELEGRDKYAIPIQKVWKYYEDNRDIIEKDYPE